MGGVKTLIFFMKKIQLPAWTVPPALLLLCLVSYGLLFHRLGFYWDDWPAVWFTKFYGASSLKEVLGIDRPQLAWLYVLTNSAIGDSMPGWQLFSLTMRWVSCLALWWTLQQIWPKNRTEVTWVTFLFAIYPGFRQQYIALIYSHDWIVITIFMLSIGLMIAAVRKPTIVLNPQKGKQLRLFWPMMVLSWVLAAYAMFADEYYVGLELLRPVLLWMVLKDLTQEPQEVGENKHRLRRVILLWLPYVAILLAFLVWRLFIHVSPRGQVQIFNQIAQTPWLGMFNLVKTIILDVLESGLIAWAIPFNLAEVINSGVTSIFAYILLASFVAAVTIFFLDRLQFTAAVGHNQGGRNTQPERSQPSKLWAKQAIVLGLFSLFIAGWPFWATAWQIGLTFPWDRFNLAMNFGASLMLTGIFILVFRQRFVIVFAIGVLVGLSSANAFHLGNLYRQDWALMKQFFWQMSWRVPGIQPDTLVLSSRPPFAYSTDNSLTAPLNWIYAPWNQTRNLPYLFYDVASHSASGWTGIDLNQPIKQQYRIMDFNGNFNHALSVFYKPPNCVKVMDSILDADLPGKPLFITAGAAFSKTDLITLNPASPATPPVEIFGPEPLHDWCYFFEKAELARQAGDWAKVAELADQAIPISPTMTEANTLEWIPYIEGYAQNDRWVDAEKWSNEVYRVHPKMRRMLCSLWQRVQANTISSPERDQLLERLNGVLACSAKNED
jgi:hypothetical protein